MTPSRAIGSQQATAVLFIGGRLHFHYVDGKRAKANSGAPSVLIAYGMDDAAVLAAAVSEVVYDSKGSVIWPEGRIPGQFVPLR